MSGKRKGLGRGLGEMGVSELLGQINEVISVPKQPTAKKKKAVTQKTGKKSPPKRKVDAPPHAGSETTEVDGTLKTVDVDTLVPGPYQPRRKMDQGALSELANSIRAQGIIQPIVVRLVKGKHEIIAGERRWRAAQMAGLTEVPVVIRDLPDKTVIAIALIENIQRQDLNVIEESLALQRLIDEFSMTHQEVAQAVGRSRAAVTNLLRLLKLEPQVRLLVERGHLDMGHARALLALPEDKQEKVANVIVARALSVRQTEQLIQRYLHADETPKTPRRRDPNIITLERDLSERLGADVAIQSGKQAGGKVVIQYHSLAELEGILAHIK